MGKKQEAQSVLPDAKPIKCHRWETSVNTLALVEERSNKWGILTENDKKTINKEIRRSARSDYRIFVENVVCDLKKQIQWETRHKYTNWQKA